MVAWLVSLSFVNKAYTPFPSKPPRRSCPSYKKGGTEELLKSTVHERARQELVTPEALEDLKQTMKMGQIATIGQADEFLREPHGIEYAHRDGVGQLLRGHKIKLKTAPPRHEEADYEEQDAFKKLRGQHRGGKRAPLRKRQTAKGCGSRYEARFGVINWHRRRYCPMGLRPPWIVKRAYKWTYPCRRRSNPRPGRVSVCSCLGWMRDALRYSWRSSQRDTLISTFWSSSTARQAIAPSKASASREH